MLESTARAKNFCDLHAKGVGLLVAFLANAKLGRPSFNKPGTRMMLELRHGKKRVRVSVFVCDKDKWGSFDLGTWEEHLMDRLFFAFGLGDALRVLRNGPDRYSMHRLLREELARRSGVNVFRDVEDAATETLATGAPQAKLKKRACQGELNRALAHLRKARKLGATPRQMKKLVSQIMAEEAVLEVQNG
jgi:hypothetical protein